MMQISCVALFFCLLVNYGSSKPPYLEADASVYGQGAIEVASGLQAGLDISESVSSYLGSMLDMSASAEAESVVRGGSNLNGGSLMDVNSSVSSDVASMASLVGEFTSLISDNPLMSWMSIDQFVDLLWSLEEAKMNLIWNLLGMAKDGFVNHMAWKISVIRDAKGELEAAVRSITDGDMKAAAAHAMEAIHHMEGMCPICQALKYALDNEDFTMLRFAASMGIGILGGMETQTDVSLSV